MPTVTLPFLQIWPLLLSVPIMTIENLALYLSAITITQLINIIHCHESCNLSEHFFRFLCFHHKPSNSLFDLSLVATELKFAQLHTFLNRNYKDDTITTSILKD